MPLTPRLILLLCFTLVSIALSAQQETVQKLLKEKRYKEADKYLDSELAKTPDNAALNFLKWKVNRMGNFAPETGFKYLNKAIDLDNKYSSAYVCRGIFYMDMLRFEDARDDFEAAIKCAANDSLLKEARLALGSYYTGTRKHQEAVAINLLVLQSDSVNIYALNNLALGYQDLGKLQEALNVLYKIEKLDTAAYYAIINIGFVLSKMDAYEKAISYFNKAEKLRKDPLVYSNRSYAEYKLKQYGPAMADINKSIKLFPGNSYAYRVRALIYLDQNNTDKACDDLKTALALKYTEMYDDDVKELRDKYCIK